MTKLFKLSIRYVPDFYYKRILFYEDHTKYLHSITNNLLSDNKYLIGGTTFPTDKAIWYLKGLEEEEIGKILQNDPFMKAGLIDEWKIKRMEIFGRTSVEGVSNVYDYTCI